MAKHLEEFRMSLFHGRYRLAVAMFVPVLLAAGCGGGDEEPDANSGAEESSAGEGSATSEGSTGGYDPGDGDTPAQYPCDAVTADEIGALLGGTYTFKLGALDACYFEPEDAAAFPTAYLAIDPFRTDFPTLKGANPGATDVDVALGGFVADEPEAASIKNGYALLTDDGVTLHVSLVSGEQADRDAKIEELLTLAVSKL